MKTRNSELRDTIIDIHQATVAGIGGKVATNGRVSPIIFIDPVIINNETISKIPVTANDLDNGITVGQTVNINRVDSKVVKLILSGSAPPLDHHCPQCTSLLIRRKSLLFCSANCQNSSTPPAGETYNFSLVVETHDSSIHQAMYQYIALKHFCRFIPVAPRSTQYNLYYNDLNQLADIGFAIGAYIKKL